MGEGRDPRSVFGDPRRRVVLLRILVRNGRRAAAGAALRWLTVNKQRPYGWEPKSAWRSVGRDEEGFLAALGMTPSCSGAAR